MKLLFCFIATCIVEARFINDDRKEKEHFLQSKTWEYIGSSGYTFADDVKDKIYFKFKKNNILSITQIQSGKNNSEVILDSLKYKVIEGTTEEGKPEFSVRIFRSTRNFSVYYKYEPNAIPGRKDSVDFQIKQYTSSSELILRYNDNQRSSMKIENKFK